MQARTLGIIGTLATLASCGLEEPAIERAARGAGTPIEDATPAAIIALSETDLQAGPGRELHFAVTIPANQSELHFDLRDGVGDADLYVRYGAAPTQADYDCRPYRAGNDERCSFVDEQIHSGTWYIMVYGYTDFAGVELTVSHQSPVLLWHPDLTGDRGAETIFSFAVPPSTSDLLVEMTGGTGDADLYVRFGEAPTQSEYDCRPYRSGNEEACSFEEPSQGTWHVMVRAYADFAGVTLSARTSQAEETATEDEVEEEPPLVNAYCSINVEGTGVVDLEEDYLPHVVACENDGAGPEALRAQAVAARTYAYYKIEQSGSVQDGQGDQVYSCDRPPRQEHYDAVAATQREVLVYNGQVIAAFYVAGADPSNRASCIATDADADPTNTEHYVTYNDGLTDTDVEQTALGWIHPQNWYNRGCMSQWGSRCLDESGAGYHDILEHYYGADIVATVAGGTCTDVPPPPQGNDAETQPTSWLPRMRIGS